MFNVGDLIKVSGESISIIGLIDSVSESVYDCTIVKAISLGGEVNLPIKNFYVPDSAEGLERILTADGVEYALECLIA